MQNSINTLITGSSQPETPIVKFQNATSVSTPKGYSHSAEIDLGNCKMIIISSQVPLDKQGNLVGKDDLAKQAEQVFFNIKSIVEDAGGITLICLQRKLLMHRALQARRILVAFLNSIQVVTFLYSAAGKFNVRFHFRE